MPPPTNSILSMACKACPRDLLRLEKSVTNPNIAMTKPLFLLLLYMQSPWRQMRSAAAPYGFSPDTEPPTSSAWQGWQAARGHYAPQPTQAEAVEKAWEAFLSTAASTGDYAFDLDVFSDEEHRRFVLLREYRAPPQGCEYYRNGRFCHTCGGSWRSRRTERIRRRRNRPCRSLLDWKGESVLLSFCG